MINEQLVVYIKERIAEGRNREEISKALESSGYTKEVIENTFSYLDNEKADNKDKDINKNDDVGVESSDIRKVAPQTLKKLPFMLILQAVIPAVAFGLFLQLGTFFNAIFLIIISLGFFVFILFKKQEDIKKAGASFFKISIIINVAAVVFIILYFTMFLPKEIVYESVFDNQKEITYINASAGERVVLSEFDFVVNNVKEDFVWRDFSGNVISDSTDVKYITVNMSVTNNTSQATIFSSYNKILIMDEEGSMHERSNSVFVSDSITFTSVNPRTTERGSVVYVVPRTVRKYSVVAINKETNDYYVISVR